MSQNDTLAPYNGLAEELQAAVNDLEKLYQERSTLQEQSKQLAAHIKATGRLLFDARSDLVEQNRIEERLADLETRQRNCGATLSGLNEHLETQEAALHALLPKSCATFSRLFIALRQTVLIQTQEAIAAFLDPTARETYREQCELLSEHSTAYTELADVAIPSGSNWSLTRPLDPESRAATMQFVLESTKQLLESAERIFNEIERCQITEPVPVPEFLLGELPVVETPTTDQNQPLTLNSLSEQEQAFIQQFCREAQRDPNNLSDSERHVLQNSLKLWHQSRLAGGRMVSVS
jgi:hypothetical protein